MRMRNSRLPIRCVILGLFVMIGPGESVTSAQERVTPAMTADIDEFAAQILATGIVPGMSLAVVTSEGIVYTKGYGFANVESQRVATADTQFYIASTTKALTALAGALLQDRERLDLDAPLSHYLPNVQMHPELSAEDVSLRDLLTMTHGIEPRGAVDIRTAFTGDFTYPELQTLLRHHPPAQNGRNFRYSNLGYNVFSLVLEDRFEGGWKQVVRDTVLLPLRMNSTTAFVTQADRARLAMPYTSRGSGLERLRYAKHDETMQAAGGHISTVNDMARFVVAQLGAGRFGDRQVFPSSVIEDTHRQHAAQDRRLGPYERYGWGLGWDLARYDGDMVVQRFGGFSGFSSHVSFMPEHDLGVVVLTNAGGPANQLGDMVARFAYQRVLGKPNVDERFDGELRGIMERITSFLSQNLAARRARMQTTPLPLAAYAGEYTSPALGRMRWTWEEDQLFVRWGVAESTVEVYDGAQYQLRVELLGGGSVVTFDVPNGATSPTGFEFLNQTFTRSISPPLLKSISALPPLNEAPLTRSGIQNPVGMVVITSPTPTAEPD